MQKEPPDPFTLEEAEVILGYLKNEPVFHNYFELAFFSGMRTSELIALTWQDIDFPKAVRAREQSIRGWQAEKHQNPQLSRHRAQ